MQNKKNADVSSSTREMAYLVGSVMIFCAANLPPSNGDACDSSIVLTTFSGSSHFDSTSYATETWSSNSEHSSSSDGTHSSEEY